MLIGLAAIFIAMVVSSWDALSGLARGRPFSGAVEISTALMPVIVFGFLAYTQARRQHIRVEILYANVSRRYQVVLDLLGYAVMAVFMSMLAWQTWLRAAGAQRVNESASGALRFPTWPVRYIVAIGAILFVAQLVLDSIRTVQAYRAEAAQGVQEASTGFTPHGAAVDEAAEMVEDLRQDGSLRDGDER